MQGGRLDEGIRRYTKGYKGVQGVQKKWGVDKEAKKLHFMQK